MTQDTTGMGGTGLPDSATRAPRSRGWTPSGVAVRVLVLGILVTAGFAWTARITYDHNESRLLRLRVRELALVLADVVPSIQTPLASAAELADATDGNPTKFKAFIAPYVGPGRQFASVSLWPLGVADPAPITVVGGTPALASLPQQAGSFFASVARRRSLSVTGILGRASGRLGYGFSTPGVQGGFAAYAESPLPKDRRSKIASSSAFSDLNYALYLGRSRRSRELLVTSLRTFPIHGRQATAVVPFGDSDFTLVGTPNGSLGGSAFESLPWIIVAIGALLSLAAAISADRLAHRREQAEGLAAALDQVADQNRQMYAEQRSIAQTLQHALLPEALPEFEGLDTSARYVPAGSGIDVGGDWYDIVPLQDGRVLLVIGDISGHGLRAATTMAALRYAARAYALDHDRPADVLAKLSDFVAGQSHRYFATVLCGCVDVTAHEISLASAGHLPPLLIDADRARYADIRVGVPVGAPREAPYEEVTFSVAPQTTMVAFTDGLVERRGEILDVGLARLRDAATADTLPLDELVSKLVRELAPAGHEDDTAILGIRWRH